LQWQTSYEANTKAFAVHRLALGQSGTYVPLMSALVGRGNQGGNYTFLDDQVDANAAYSYLLVEEKNNGRFIGYYDLLIVAGAFLGSEHQVLIPVIRR